MIDVTNTIYFHRREYLRPVIMKSYVQQSSRYLENDAYLFFYIIVILRCILFTYKHIATQYRYSRLLILQRESYVQLYEHISLNVSTFKIKCLTSAIENFLHLKFLSQESFLYDSIPRIIKENYSSFHPHFVVLPLALSL